LSAAFTSSFAFVLAQERGDDRAKGAGVNAQPGAAGAAEQPGRMERLLKAWERQSEKLKSLDVQINRIDKTPAWDEEIRFQGRAVFKRPELAYLNFNKVKTATDAKGKPAPVIDPKTGKPVAIPYETIVCSGKEVWQYLHDVREIFVYPLAKEERKRALDEGPLPFLFNMKAVEAERRYLMSLEGQTKEYYFVVVQPRLQQDQESFKKAWIWLHPTYLLPLRIVLFAPDGKSTKDFRLGDIKANKPFEDRDFQGGVPPGQPGDRRPPWKVVRNPDAQGRPRAEGAVPDRQPALRPPGPDRQRR
jgi:TIGR03009 family protein